uniref:Conotoxin ar5b n=1 Tax=Conus araneosus TaxID=101286 RepID=CT10B_CONAO|nr:RecName: Full=Conotoxin ar5b [Conus araneosus]
RCCGYKFCYIC